MGISIFDSVAVFSGALVAQIPLAIVFDDSASSGLFLSDCPSCQPESAAIYDVWLFWNCNYYG